MNIPPNISVADTFVRSVTVFYMYFLQRLQEEKHCGTCSFPGMLHYGTVCVTCVTTKAREKLQEKLSSVRVRLDMQGHGPPRVTIAGQPMITYI